MKKLQILSLLLIAALLLCGCSAAQTPQPTTAPTPEAAPSPTTAPTPVPTPTPKPVSAEVQALVEQNGEVWREIHRRDGMEGRLLIPSANINVALFTWIDIAADQGDITEQVRQTIVDREDSAALYNDGYGNIIADHSNQAFSRLSEVAVGDPAYLLAGDHVISLRCDLVTDGTNTGNGITLAEGKPANESEDYTCYTCLENWTHVLIVGFRITDQDSFDVDRFDLGEPAQSTPVPTENAAAQAEDVVPFPLSTQAPVPTPIYTPTRSPEPAAEPGSAPAQQQADDWEPDYDAILGGYDIYANTDSDPGMASGDGYLF